MERFICQNTNSGSAANSNDLLSLLKSNLANDQIDRRASDSADGWDRYNHSSASYSKASSATYSLTDISASNAANKPKATTGWKIIDGKKTYTTFRAGKLIRAEGYEGFKLAMSDGNAGPKKGERGAVLNQSGPDVPIEVSENKENSQPTASFAACDSSKAKKRSRQAEEGSQQQQNKNKKKQQGSIQSFFAAK
jgi:hypothetical protein